MPSLDDIYNQVNYSTTISNKDKAKIINNIAPAVARKEGIIGAANTSAAGGVAQAAIQSQASIFGFARQALSAETTTAMREEGATQRTGMMEAGANQRTNITQSGLNTRFNSQIGLDQAKFNEDKFRARKEFGQYSPTSSAPRVDPITLKRPSGNMGEETYLAGRFINGQWYPMESGQAESQDNSSVIKNQINGWLNPDTN